MAEVHEDVLERLKSVFTFLLFFSGIFANCHLSVVDVVEFMCFRADMAAPLITLMSASAPELGLTILQHIELLLIRKPDLFGLLFVYIYIDNNLILRMCMLSEFLPG